MLGAVIVLGLLSGLIVYFAFGFGGRKSDGELPGPRGLPILKHLVQFYQNLGRLDDWLVSLHDQYGDTFVVGLPGKPEFLFTTNPKNVEYILKTNFANYEKGAFFRNNLHDLLGDGIFNSDGEAWRPQRKITSNLFNVKNFRDGMLHTFVEHGVKVLNIIDKNPNEVDVSELFYRFALDSIGCIAFGSEIDSLGNPEVSFATSWDRSNTFIVERFFSLSSFLRKFAPVERVIAKDIEVMNAFAGNILKKRKEENQESLESRFDLLSLFMSRRNTDGLEFSDKYLRDMILNMIIAGRDTTAQSLAWTCYLLCQHPEIKQKIMEEVDQTFGESGVPDYDSVKSLEYIHAVVTESLRLYPSVPRDPHECGSDDVLPTGHKVKAGTSVFYFAYGMGRSTDIWGPDARSFNPDRFYQDPKLANNTFKFTAFQGGPRTCLGQNMAYLEEKTLLAMIFQKYDIELIPGQDVKILFSLTLPMQRNLRLKFIPRKR